MNSTLFISDLHLASNKCKAHHLLEFLKKDESIDTYLVGDIIDIWRFQQAFRMDATTQSYHVDCIRKILKRSSKRGSVHYIWGNHDEFMYRFSESKSFGGVHLHERCDYTASDGRRYLVLHGHQFDLICKFKFGILVSKIGDYSYDVLIEINEWYNWVRKKLGFQYSSLSKYVKVKFKKASMFIGSFEKHLAEYAKQNNYDGVICGHIHDPADKMINGIHYLNCGCWTDEENLNYLLDKGDGSGIMLCKYKP
jgi:UDP-2,3-diacylglucosamine pyrophosphatase LpxH